MLFKMDIMKLSDAAAAMGSKAPCEAEITSVSIDSRTISEGCLFIAIKGENFDGHSFVNTVLSEGAAAAVCSHAVPGAEKKTVLVEDTRKALRQIAAYNRSRYRIPVIGVTGSVGKTTTKNMVASVMRTTYNTLATETNLNNEIGLPRMCLRLDSSHEAAVLEMGMSGFGEISNLTNVARPTVGLITNIGVSHIEMLGSREGILQAKLEILDGMEPDAPLILNVDNDMLSLAASQLKGSRPVVTYGVDTPECDCRASDIKQTEEDITFTLSYQGVEYEVYIPVIGMHNVYNACAAFLCGIFTGVTPENALKGLREYVPDGRRQNICHFGEYTFIEDCYNASPDSITAALSVLSSVPCTGRRIAVLGDMLELGEYARKAHHDCGVQAAESGVDMLFAYGPYAAYYVEGAGERVSSRLYDDKEQLAADLAEAIEPGDAVLFKASRGMKLEDVYNKVYEIMGLGREE